LIQIATNRFFLTTGRLRGEISADGLIFWPGVDIRIPA
jgi:hypothetical protein